MNQPSAPSRARDTALYLRAVHRDDIEAMQELSDRCDMVEIANRLCHTLAVFIEHIGHDVEAYVDAAVACAPDDQALIDEALNRLVVEGGA